LLLIIVFDIYLGKMINNKKKDSQFKPVNVKLINKLLFVYSLIVIYVGGFSDVTFLFLFFAMIGFISTRERAVEVQKRVDLAKKRQRFTRVRQRVLAELAQEYEETAYLVELLLLELDDLKNPRKPIVTKIVVENPEVQRMLGVIEATNKLVSGLDEAWKNRPKKIDEKVEGRTKPLSDKKDEQS